MLRTVLPMLVCGAVCTGCSGGGGDEIPKHEVSGTVTLKGQPLAEGTISFVPADGQGPTAGAAIQEGQYTAQVPPGPKRVEIHAVKVVGQRKMFDTPDSPTVDVTEELVPPQYNTESTLHADVQDDRDDLNFTLE
jgi:hypothetical protein